MKLTEEKIIKIMESVFKQKKGGVDRKTPIESVVRDSMDVIEFIAILEEKYNVVINPNEIIDLTNIGEFIDYILTHQVSTKKKKSFIP